MLHSCLSSLPYRLMNVMHSDGSSFGGDVVLNSVNMGSRDEDSNSDQLICKGNIFGALLWGFQILKVIGEIAYLE